MLACRMNRIAAFLGHNVRNVGQRFDFRVCRHVGQTP